MDMDSVDRNMMAVPRQFLLQDDWVFGHWDLDVADLHLLHLKIQNSNLVFQGF